MCVIADNTGETTVQYTTRFTNLWFSLITRASVISLPSFRINLSRFTTGKLVILFKHACHIFHLPLFARDKKNNPPYNSTMKRQTFFTTESQARETHIADTLWKDSFNLYGKILLARAHKVWKKITLSCVHVE